MKEHFVVVYLDDMSFVYVMILLHYIRLKFKLVIFHLRTLCKIYLNRIVLEDKFLYPGQKKNLMNLEKTQIILCL